MTDDFSDPANWHPIEEHPYLNDPPKVTPIPGITDDLRTRIAAVVEDHDVEQEGVNYWQCTCGDKFYLSQDEYRSWQEHLADAVIRELGLKRNGCPCTACNLRRPDNAHRYVTEWETGE